MLAGPLAKTIVGGTDWTTKHVRFRWWIGIGGTGLSASTDLWRTESVVASKTAKVCIGTVRHSGNTNRYRRGYGVWRRTDVTGRVKLTNIRAVSIVA